MVVLRKDNGIWISRGDTSQIDIHFGYDVPPDGTVCSMSLKEHATRASVIWEKEVEIKDAMASFIIESGDTNRLGFGEYKWDIRLYYEDGNVLTPFKPAQFKIIETVGNAKTIEESPLPLRAQHMDIGIHNQTNTIDVDVEGGSRRLDVLEVVHADVAQVATQLETPRTIRLAGDISGEIAFDGSSDVELQTSIEEISEEELEELFNE